MLITVQPEILLRSIGKRSQKRGSRLVFGIDRFRLLHHLERLVIATRSHTSGTSLAQIGDEDRKDSAVPRIPSLRRREDCIHFLKGHRNLIDDGKEFSLGLFGESV